MARGVFITLEGVEGSGKTTHAAALADVLRDETRDVILTREPGGTPAGRAIRNIFLDPNVSLDVVSELLLVLADRAQHVREELKPAVERGAIVISDRYCDSTIAYQGYGRGLDLDLLRSLNRLATDSTMPDLTIVLDCSVVTGLARTRERVKGQAHAFDRFESEREEFHKRVREGFLAIAGRDTDRVVVINSERPRDAVSQDILATVRALLERRCL